MNDRTGWFAEYDDDKNAWQPMLELRIGVIPTMDIWFATEEACEEFIRKDIIGQGMLDLTGIELSTP